MNKNKITSTLIIIAAVAAVSSCKKNTKCKNLEAAVVKADSVFYSLQSNVNCVAYKAAMQAWLDETSCSKDNATKSSTYTQQISALNCQ